MNYLDKQTIYDLMTGQLNLEEFPVLGSEQIQDEFAEGMPCDKLYREVYEAECRLCRRLGVVEDHDVELIVSNLLRIAGVLALKMYDYGETSRFA